MLDASIYQNAKQRYLELGVDTDKALSMLDDVYVSMNCWQGDDITGFEQKNNTLTGGIQTTGSYPGKARNMDELCDDIAKAVSLIPGKLKLNIHAIYGDFQGEKIDRDRIAPKHYEKWVEFAKRQGMGLDFNPTLFSHEKSDGFSISSKDKGIRDFWIEHCKASRRVSEYFGKELHIPSVNNIWAPDGFKDTPVDRYGYRAILKDSLDEIFSEKLDNDYNLDAVEGKLFGIGSESCVIGSNDFYLAYAVKNNVLLTLDTGHFHPTELVSDKISTALSFIPQILLHVSRPVRWDSDHVVIYNEELKSIADEIIRNGFEKRVHIGLDFFDASINRIAAWVIGTRNMKKAVLAALLEPGDMLKKAEQDGDYTTRLALTEELKTYPISAVWDYYCQTRNVPVGYSWMNEVKNYEEVVLSKR